MKSPMAILDALEAFKTHQDIAQLRKKLSALENVHVRPVLHQFFSTGFKTKYEFINRALMTISLPIGSPFISCSLLLSAIFHILQAIIYDLCILRRPKSSAIILGMGLLYACLSGLFFIGIVVMPIINLVSMLTKLVFNKSDPVDHSTESRDEHDSAEINPEVSQKPVSSSEKDQRDETYPIGERTP